MIDSTIPIKELTLSQKYKPKVGGKTSVHFLAEFINKINSRRTIKIEAGEMINYVYIWKPYFNVNGSVSKTKVSERIWFADKVGREQLDYNRQIDKQISFVARCCNGSPEFPESKFYKKDDNFADDEERFNEIDKRMTKFISGKLSKQFLGGKTWKERKLMYKRLSPILKMFPRFFINDSLLTGLNREFIHKSENVNQFIYYWYKKLIGLHNKFRYRISNYYSKGEELYLADILYELTERTKTYYNVYEALYVTDIWYIQINNASCALGGCSNKKKILSNFNIS